MNIGQIESALADIFAQPLTDGEPRKVVFWVDRDGEFAEDVARLSLDDTQLELVTAGSWLMDTVLYAQTFHADRVFDHFERIGH